MKYMTQNGVCCSAFSLGTVQLGLAYGINNIAGKPSREAAFQILDAAVDVGVNNLDTASGYGDSEEVIGAWLKTCPEDKQPMVTTKIMKLDFSSDEALKASVRQKIEESKQRLGLTTIPMLMLHHAQDYTQNPGAVMAALQEAKDSGAVDKIGISLYAEDDIPLIAAAGFDAVQLPLNIFDWRLIENGSLHALAAAGMQVFVRSVFLQGMVFKNPATLPDGMQIYRPALEKFRGLCEGYQMEPAVLAASFVLSLPGVTSLVLGCEQEDQVRMNAALMDRCVTLTQAQLEEARQAFEDVVPSMLDPRTWPGHC